MRYLFVLSILFSSIAAVSAQAAVITLGNGDVLNAEVIAETDSTVTVQHPLLGELVIPRAAIAEISAATSIEQTPTEQATPTLARADTGLVGTGVLQDFTRRLEIGLSGAQGKSDNLKFRLGFEGDFEDEKDRWAFDAVYSYDESDGIASENDFFAELIRDWLRPGSLWFYFARARYDWDEFKDWDHRISASGGAGYDFLTSDTWTLSGRAGLGANQTFGGEREEFTPEALLGLNGRWRINGAQSLVFRTFFYPSLNDLGELRNISSMEWSLRMATAQDLSLKLGFSNEYDSQATIDTDKNDFKYYGSLVWGL